MFTLKKLRRRAIPPPHVAKTGGDVLVEKGASSLNRTGRGSRAGRRGIGGVEIHRSNLIHVETA